MANTLKPLVAKELATSLPGAADYTVPALTDTRITEIWLCNNSGTGRSVTIHLIPSGGTAGDDNSVMKTWPIPPGVPVPLALNTILDAGDTIKAFASGADVACRISGIEVA